MIVADSTLVSGFVFPADDFYKVARAVRAKDSDWRCPELVCAEVRNVGLKHHKKGEPLDSVISQCNLAEGSVSISRMPSHSVLSVASEGGLTAYDAEYVALARQLKITLVTSDTEVLKKFPAVAMTPEQFLKK